MYTIPNTCIRFRDSLVNTTEIRNAQFKIYLSRQLIKIKPTETISLFRDLKLATLDLIDSSDHSNTESSTSLNKVAICSINNLTELLADWMS